MKETLTQQCLNLLKRDDIKTEIKKLMKPLFEVLFYELAPYIYIMVALVFLMFVMVLAILILLILIIKPYLTPLIKNKNLPLPQLL